MAKTNGDWERINAVITRANMTANYFAKYIGLPCGENIYRIKRGDNGISRDVAERIVFRFPEISKGWLLTGEGSMLRGSDAAHIPFFDGKMHDVLSGREQNPAYHIMLPELKDCDLAVKYAVDGVADDHVTLLLQRKSVGELEIGKIYAFTTPERTMLSKWGAAKSTRTIAEKAVAIHLVRGRLVMND